MRRSSPPPLFQLDHAINRMELWAEQQHVHIDGLRGHRGSGLWAAERRKLITMLDHLARLRAYRRALVAQPNRLTSVH